MEHVQKDTLNLFRQLIYSLFMYLFTYKVVGFIFKSCAHSSSSPVPAVHFKKKQWHLARSHHTTALYTVSLNLECKYVAWSQLTSELAFVCLHVTVTVCLCAFLSFITHKPGWCAPLLCEADTHMHASGSPKYPESWGPSRSNINTHTHTNTH